MSEVKRYSPSESSYGIMRECDEGEWVDGYDYDAIAAEAQALREEVAALKHSQQVLIGSRNAHRDERDAARKEVAALRARVAVVPDGYALVPVEPTREMFIAINKEDDKAYAGGCHHGAQFEWLWDAAIEAAPRHNALTVSEGLLRRVCAEQPATCCMDDEMSWRRDRDSALIELRALLNEDKENGNG